ncbi:MAG: hypothetical protein Q8918_17920, partial [Bacteroidota bacterium]|nr:hypothetical protein [Bacteroidota bacterium]
ISFIRQKRIETMPKQTGPNPFTGRRGNLQGYRMAGKYYVRIVSSLTAKRVLKDPAFKLTMQYAGLLGKASKIASAIYRLLPEREHGFYRKLTGMAMQLLKQGKTAEEAFEKLYNDFIRPPVKSPVQKPVFKTSFADELLNRLFSKSPVTQDLEEEPVPDYPPS